MMTSMRPKNAIYIALTSDRTTWQIQSWRPTISKWLDMMAFSAIMLFPDASRTRGSGVGNLPRYETSEPPRRRGPAYVVQKPIA
jgi:hypothetical protein